jgi:type II secretory pathway pseudopilin PulG
MELLIVISIISVLASLTFVVANGLRQQAMQTQEVAAARSLLAALGSYSGDNAGEILPGVDRTVTAKAANGTTISGEPAYRYPWRLAPYVGYEIRGTFITDVNKGIKPEDTYMVSISPALGWNAHLVGGYVHSLAPNGADKNRYCEEECATRMSTPGVGRVIAFASAWSKRYEADPGSKGNFLVAAPGLTAPGFSPWINRKSVDPKGNSVDTGHVDFRHPGGRAIVGRVDGSVEALTFDEIRDMRNWSTGAIAKDDADYRISWK